MSSNDLRSMDFTRKLAGLLHMLFCGRAHEEDMLKFNQETSDKCCYYLEHSLDDPWKYEAHDTWIAHANQFVREVGRGNPERAFKLLSKLVRQRQELEQLFHECNELRRWFELLF